MESVTLFALLLTAFSIILFLLNIIIYFYFWFRTEYHGEDVDRAVLFMLKKPTQSFTEDIQNLYQAYKIWRGITMPRMSMLTSKSINESFVIENILNKDFSPKRESKNSAETVVKSQLSDNNFSLANSATKFTQVDTVRDFNYQYFFNVLYTLQL